MRVRKEAGMTVVLLDEDQAVARDTRPCCRSRGRKASAERSRCRCGRKLPTARDDTRPMCRACGVLRACRPRSLCWAHYYDPAVRAQFPSTSRFANRGLAALDYERPLPPQPTSALPGTPEKVAVLEERALLGFGLWHPDDPQLVQP
jgi:hypothetical protein